MIVKPTQQTPGVRARGLVLKFQTKGSNWHDAVQCAIVVVTSKVESKPNMKYYWGDVLIELNKY